MVHAQHDDLGERDDMHDQPRNYGTAMIEEDVSRW
jgi:hypothetical protein